MPSPGDGRVSGVGWRVDGFLALTTIADMRCFDSEPLGDPDLCLMARPFN